MRVTEWLAEQVTLATDAITLVSIREGRGLRAYYRADGRPYVVLAKPVADAGNASGITWLVKARRNNGDRALIAETTSTTTPVFSRTKGPCSTT